MQDILKDIWSSLRTNKLRTVLTGFAVSWGIFMLIVLLGAGNGLINATTSNNGDYLPNTIMVYGGYTSMPYDGLPGDRAMSLDEKDVWSLQGKDMQDIIVADAVGGIVSQHVSRIRYGKESLGSPTITGVDKNYARRNNIRMLCGRFINTNDEKERRKVIVLTYRNARTLLGSPEAGSGKTDMSEKADEVRPIIGRYVRMDGLLFKVVGVIASEETSFSEESYIPSSTLNTVYAKGVTVDEIELEFKGFENGTGTQEDLKRINDRIKTRLNANHRADPRDKSSFGIWNRLSSKLMMETSINMIRTALWIVGILTLLSGIIGVSNIMLITVKERTHEFGIRKAIGAKPRSILGLILAESVLITGLFGYIGMFLGVLACEAMDHIAGTMTIDIGVGQAEVFKDPTVGLGVCIGATVLLIAAGTLAGLTPARKAAKVRPIEALREE